jgi:hypothetical protein
VDLNDRHAEGRTSPSPLVRRRGSCPIVVVRRGERHHLLIEVRENIEHNLQEDPLGAVKIVLAGLVLHPLFVAEDSAR